MNFSFKGIATLDGDVIVDGLRAGVRPDVAERLGKNIHELVKLVEKIDDEAPKRDDLTLTADMLRLLDAIIADKSAFSDDEAERELGTFRFHVAAMSTIVKSAFMN